MSGEYTIPNSVTSIESSAFYGCSGLTSVTIPNSVTSIGNYAFRHCSSLTSVTIPNSVTSIGDNAFQGCSGLTSVTIPNSVTSIGTAAFAGCSGLTSVTIPNSVTSIDWSAFKDCSGLTSVTIPNSITSIGRSAFQGCSGLTSVTIPNSVTSIEAFAFSGCSGLTSVTIPNSITSIGQSAFQDCSGLTSVTIPNSVTSIGQSAFESCSKLAEFTIEDGHSPIAFANKALYESSIKKLYIGRNWTYAAQESLCIGISSVTLGEKVTKLPNFAFNGCSSLTSVTIPNSVTSIGSNAFQDCSKLAEFTIEDGDSIIELNGKVFYKCPIKNLYIGRNWTYTAQESIGTEISSVTLGEKVTKLPNYAFYGCSRLTSVIIPKSVTSIGGSAFSGCRGLVKSAYPNTLANPFQNGVTVGYDPEDAIIEDGFIYGPEKTCIQFAPYTLESEFTIPNSVTAIGEFAFSGCSGLTSVIIPNSVTSIGDNAFNGCSSINAVTVYATEPPLFAENAFNGLYETATLSIPRNSLNEYLCSSWTLFKSLKVADSELSLTDYSDGVLDYYLLAAETAAEKNIAIVRKGNYASLSTLTIPERFTADDSQRYYITGIAYGAFKNCTKLKEVTFHNKSTISTIGNDAFMGSGISSIILPKTVASIGNGAFNGCTSLTSVTIPNSVASISNNAFNGCTSLTSVTIPNSVTSVGESAFANCSALASVSFGSGVKAIPNNAFAGCKLSKVVLPPAVETVGSSAFANNSNLKEVAMGANISSVGDKAFVQAPLEKVFITTPEPPAAPTSAFSRYAAKLFVQGEAAVDAYYDAMSCWDRFEGFAMSVPQSVAIGKPSSVEGLAGESFTLTATLIPSNVHLPYVFWRSTDSTKAYVDNNGKVTVLQNITEDDNLEIIAETLYHNGPVGKFSFYPVTTGFDEIVSDTAAAVDVFTLQGVQVLHNAAREQFDNLATGIYIVRSGNDVKKVMKK